MGLCLARPVSKPRRATAGRCLGETGSWRRAERLQGVWAGGWLAADCVLWHMEVPGTAKVAGELG